MDSITEKLLKVYQTKDSKKEIIEDKTVEETGPYSDYNLDIPAADYLKKIIDKPLKDRNFIERTFLSVNKSYKTNKKTNEKARAKPVIDKSDKRLMRSLNNRGDVERYFSIFTQNPTVVKKYLKDMSETGESNVFDNKNIEYIKKNSHPEDFKKYQDFLFQGEGMYDFTYRSKEEAGKLATRKIVTNKLVQPFAGFGVGIYNAYQGGAELAAVLGDVSGLTENSLENLEKAFPAMDLEALYGEGAGGIAKAVAVLTQYGLGFGIAKKIVTKLLKKAGKVSVAGATVAGAVDKFAKINKYTQGTTSLAKFGGYWALPAAIGDTVVSNQSNVTLGQLFGDEKGGLLKRTLAKSKLIPLDGLTGKKRAAAVLKNKLIFGAEGTALFGGISLVGPGLKVAAKTLGFGLKYVAEPALLTIPSKLLTYEFAKQPLAIANPWGRSRKNFPLSKYVSKDGKKIKMPEYIWKAKDLNALQKFIGKSELATDLTSLPGLLRLVKKGVVKGLDKTIGVPKFEMWKFSNVMRPGTKGEFFKGVFDMTYARFKSDFVFNKPTGNIKRKQEDMMRSARKKVDLFMKNIDRSIYKLVGTGFTDALFTSRTSNAAMRMWDDVLEVLRGNKDMNSIPKGLRLNTKLIRKLIDDQTLELKPLLKDDAIDLKNTLIANMGKYLHTSYEIFRNSKWNPPKELYEDAVSYFEGLLKPLNQKLTQSELRLKAIRKVEDILTIGRSEGSTAMERLRTIAKESQKVRVDEGIFKSKVEVPEAIAQLMGRVDDPKNIIVNTVMEQAHTIHSFKAYKDMARIGLDAKGAGKWIFKDAEEYSNWLIERKRAGDIPANFTGEGVVPISVKKAYNVDLEGVFKNADGSDMFAIPSMAKAISDDSVMADLLLKIPFFKTALAIKATVQVNKTVLSVMTQMRNITTAASFALANGHMGAGASVADNFEMLFKEMLGKTTDPKKLRELLEEGLEAGALDSSTIATELQKVIPELMGTSTSLVRRGKKINIDTKYIKASANIPGADKLSGSVGSAAESTIRGYENLGKTSDQIFEWMLTNKGLAGKVVQKSIEAYQMGDNIWKLFGYQFTKSQLKPALKNLDDVRQYFKEIEGYEWNPFKSGSSTAGTNGRNLKTLDDAIKEIAGIQVRNVYPNYSMVPRVVGNIRKIPIMGNFVGFTSEMWRNSFQILTRGTKELKSSNPYIRQMGARRLSGFFVTSGIMGPVLYDTALKLTGVPGELIEKWKERFAPEYQKYSTMIPISYDKKKKTIMAVDFSAMMPYDDVTKPFRQTWEMIQAGGTTDQSAGDIWYNAFVKSTLAGIQPFVSPAIWWETAKPFLPAGVPGSTRQTNSEGTINRAVDKNKMVIVDYLNDRDSKYVKTLKYIYDKTLPTTLQSVEKIVKAMQGQVSRGAVAYDPETEVIKAITGLGITKIDPIKNFRYKVVARAVELSNAKSRFRGPALDGGKLYNDALEIKNGYPANATHVSDLYDALQKNLYRIWTETYKDIEVMKLFYDEDEIRTILEDRRGYSKTETDSLIDGFYIPSKLPNLNTYTKNMKEEESGPFQQRIKEINRQLNLDLELSDFINEEALEDIYNKWDTLKLGFNIDEQEDELNVPTKFKLKKYRDKIKKDRILKKLQRNRFIGQNFIGEKPTPENNVRPFNAKLDNQASLIKPNVPSDTAPVSAETIKTASVNNNVNPQTNLTRIEDALLSQTEKAIKLGQRKTTV